MTNVLTSLFDYFLNYPFTNIDIYNSIGKWFNESAVLHKIINIVFKVIMQEI